MNEWTEDTVVDCDYCEKTMFPNISTWDDEDGGGCGWIGPVGKSQNFTRFLPAVRNPTSPCAEIECTSMPFPALPVPTSTPVLLL